MKTISNPRRGCGHLKPGAYYLRLELAANGELPAFVRYVQPVPYFGPHFRGWRGIYPLPWEIADMRRTMPPAKSPLLVVGRPTNYMGGLEPIPEWFDHLDRIARSWETQTAQAVTRAVMAVGNPQQDELSLWSVPDILHWAGGCNYPDPEVYIAECAKHGISKRIPSGVLPAVIPSKTRLFCIHPNALGEKQAAIVGYSYLTGIYYTAKRNEAERPADLRPDIQFVTADPEGDETGTGTLFPGDNDD